MIKDYLKEINKLKSQKSNEHTYRTPLENMIKYFVVKLYPRSSITIKQESSIDSANNKNLKKVFPDFTVDNEDERLIGFIECKDIGFDLHRAIDGKGNFKIYREQILKYLDIHNNLIYTDYINFIHLVLEENQGQTKKLKIKDEVCLEKGADSEKRLEKIFEEFLGATVKEINRKDYFLSLLARRTAILRDYINEELVNNNSYLKKDIKGLFESTIFNDLSDKDFADAFSQIISFSLLFYRLSERKNTDRNSFKNMPEYIPIFREFLSKIDIENFNSRILYSINSIINAVNAYNQKMFYSQFATSSDKEDPFIYAYEYFLKEFDAKTRNARGVFYTPIEAVRYIVKSIDEIIKDKLNIADGIYGEEVHILDFAAGTGTFMLGAIERAFENASKNNIAGIWENIASDFILKRLYGFEFLIVPYVIAHFRIHEYLKDLNYDYKKKERLQLYLTNTLDNEAGGEVKMFPKFQEESDNAYKIKNEKPILVIMGNPPYNAKSEEINRKDWIIDKLKYYKKGLTATEKGSIEDDYIKFIRFAHWKMEKAEKGIIGIIVNNSFISGVSHREMRKELMQTFDEIYILDLHGNVNKGEKCPDGSADFNIFNIKNVGVCIALFVKTGKNKSKDKKCEVYFNEIFGSQEYKRKYLSGKSINSEKLIKLEEDKKYHWFSKVKSNEKYFSEFIGLNEIFKEFNSGITTEKDELIIQLNENNLNSALEDIKKLEVEEICKKYNLKISQNKINCLNQAKREVENNEGYKTIIHYRPFDFRNIYYTPSSDGCIGRPRYDIMKHFINKQNIGLAFTRLITSQNYHHTLITDKITDCHINSSKDYIAPLYLYQENSTEEFKLEEEKKPNWTDYFEEFLQNYISKNPREILNYIYAILYCPTYRENYKEDLKYDFPRIPFTKNKNVFDKLQNIGNELVDLHLLKKIPNSNVGYPIAGEHKIDCLKYEEESGRLYINEKQYFENVKKEIYNYSIGGYNPLEKYIKARKIFTLNDIKHLIKVIAVIERTIYLQDKIRDIYATCKF